MSTKVRGQVRAKSVERVVSEVRQMISSGALTPGQQIRQENMAERLGMSRLPVREALRQLTADGLVTHVPNVGYSVARISQSEFSQIYTMRRLLETEIIKSLPKPSTRQMQRIIVANDKVIEACDRLDLAEMQHRNQEFHFEMFRLSHLELIIDEIERLWNWAAPYHAVYLCSAESRHTVVEEHAAMVDSLREGDNERLADMMDRHRNGSETHLMPWLRAGNAGPSVV